MQTRGQKRERGGANAPRVLLTGSMTVYPQPFSTVRAAEVAGCVHMSVFIAGHNSTCKKVWGAVRGA